MQPVLRKAIFIAFIVIAGCEYIPFSGGELDGTVTPAPTEWSEVAQASVIHLETNPEDPYSVKLWAVGLGPALYVHAGANQTTWVDNIAADARVRVLIDGKVYELRAERVEESDLFKQFSDKYEIKYGNRPRNENVAEVYLYRLLPRD